MGYTETVLLKNEKLVYRAQAHWGAYIRPIFFLMFPIFYLMFDISFYYPVMSSTFVIIIVAFLFFYGLHRLIFLLNSEYVVTTRRIIKKEGFIARLYTELMLNKSDGLAVYQSTFGRLLGYGTVIVVAGNLKNKCRYIANPIIFRNKVSEQIELIFSAQNDKIQTEERG